MFREKARRTVKVRIEDISQPSNVGCLRVCVFVRANFMVCLLSSEKNGEQDSATRLNRLF